MIPVLQPMSQLKKSVAYEKQKSFPGLTKTFLLDKTWMWIDRDCNDTSVILEGHCTFNGEKTSLIEKKYSNSNGKQFLSLIIQTNMP